MIIKPLKRKIMADKQNKKGTDRDVKPTRGQESNENWDDQNKDQSGSTKGDEEMNVNRVDEETNTTGIGSAQRNKPVNVAPLDPDLEQLPSEKRRERGGNQTGPGLG